MYDYPVIIHEDENPGVAVTAPDLPEFNSAGDDVADALRESVDGIETALSIYVEQRRTIPQASKPEPGQHVIHLPAVTVAKIVLWNEMMARDMRKADLCRLLEISQTQGDRLVDFLHGTKIDAVERALHLLGTRLAIVAMRDDGIHICVHTKLKKDGCYWHLLRRSDTPLDSIPEEIASQFKGIEPTTAPAELNGMWLIEPCARELQKKGWSSFELKHA